MGRDEKARKQTNRVKREKIKGTKRYNTKLGSGK